MQWHAPSLLSYAADWRVEIDYLAVDIEPSRSIGVAFDLTVWPLEWQLSSSPDQGETGSPSLSNRNQAYQMDLVAHQIWYPSLYAPLLCLQITFH